MGSVEPGTLIEGPEAWYAKDYQGRSDWINHLTEQHVAGMTGGLAGTPSQCSCWLRLPAEPWVFLFWLDVWPVD